MAALPDRLTPARAGEALREALGVTEAQHDVAQAAQRMDLVEARLRAAEERACIAFVNLGREIQRLAVEAPGDARGERKEPYLPYLIDRASLEPHHTVLDVGCGPGRLASELAGYLGSVGAYHGVDVRAKLIDRLNRWFAGVPNFTFHLADVANETYNPDGSVAPATFRFPFADHSIDFVCLRSVFTHMFPDDIEAYVEEFARLVRPGGRTFITYYLLNEQSRAYVEQAPPGGPGAFPYDHGTYRVADEEQPLNAIAIDEEFVRDVYARHGFTIEEPVGYGSWSGRESFLSRQDILVARRGR